MSGGPESAVSRETASRETDHQSDQATSSGNGDDGFTAPTTESPSRRLRSVRQRTAQARCCTPIR